MDNKANFESKKRSKILMLSFAITVAVFLEKVMQTERLFTWQVYLIALIGAIVVYIGMIWVMAPDLNKRILLIILPQSSLFVFSEVLFLELFFFEKFERVYEALIMFVLLSLFYLGTYASLLASNVLSISTFKPIPLEHAAKTTAYIISLIMVYFLTFSIISSEFSFFIFVPLLAFVYLLIIVAYAVILKFPEQYFYNAVMSVGWGMLIMTVAATLFGTRPEVLSLLPTAVMFSMFGIYINKFEEKLSWVNLLEYSFVVITVFIGIFFLRA